MTTIVVSWLLWGSSTVISLFRENHGWWDSILSQTSEQILLSMPDNVYLLAQNPAPRKDLPASYKRDDITYQILFDQKIVLKSPRAPDTPMNPSMADGFVSLPIGKETWRIYTLSDPKRNLQIQVSRQHNILKDLWNILNFGIINILLLCVTLAIATWWITRWLLSELNGVQAAMQNKKAFDLTPIPIDRLPKEIRPLVDSFNRLLGRVDRAVQNERSSALEQLSSGIKRCARLAEQLLDLARLDAEKTPQSYEVVDLTKVIQLVIKDFEIIAQQKGVKILVDADPSFLLANLDEIGILLRNLIDNAIRFSNSGGTVLVLCKNIALNGKEIIQLKVADEGPGVPHEEHERIFGRFYRVPGSQTRGSGIGLSLVAHIAHSQQATIEVGDGLNGRGFGISILFPIEPFVKPA